MSTKRKKTMAISLSVFTGVLLLALLYVWLAVPFTWYRPDETETVECEYIFPTPDTVKYKKNFTHALDAEDEAKLIAIFEKLMASSTGVDHWKMIETPHYIRKQVRIRGALEFRYDTRMKCNPHLLGWEDGKEFDALWLFLSEKGNVTVIRVLDGKPICSSEIMCGISRELLDEYAATQREVFAHYNFEKPDWLKE